MPAGWPVPTVGDQGALPESLPSLFWPQVPLTWQTLQLIGPYAIGLALVGQVARRHGGEVRIGASPLGGAEFEVTFRPVRVAAGGAP